jgi:hypothetical protein
MYTTFQVGRLRCHALEAGRQHLDGGAMFGIVPKALWARRAPPDDRNRIPLALRCLLVEHDDGLVLIDTGIGNKEDQKFIDIYGVENKGRERAHQARRCHRRALAYHRMTSAGSSTRTCTSTTPAETRRWTGLPSPRRGTSCKKAI